MRITGKHVSFGKICVLLFILVVLVVWTLVQISNTVDPKPIDIDVKTNIIDKVVNLSKDKSLKRKMMFFKTKMAANKFIKKRFSFSKKRLNKTPQKKRPRTKFKFFKFKSKSKSKSKLKSKSKPQSKFIINF